jgi:poly-gamma-glutamate capsule biosynthesis protein CapA/YwtB (metallophosphatase superfamily)
MNVIVCGDYIVGDKAPAPNLIGELQKHLEKADYSIYNQEHPITTSSKIYKTKAYGPTGACSQDSLMPILHAGFKCASLATNHIFNRGIEGLNDTLLFFKNHGIDTVGAGVNLIEARKPLIIQKSSVNLAILNFAEREFNIATSKHGGANPLDIIENVAQIKSCKEKYGNVLVIIHGGVEYCSFPTSRMVKQYRFYADNGASAIVCHHSHVISAYEDYKGVPIFYGLGNFIPYKYISSIFSSEEYRTSISVKLTFGNSGIERYDMLLFHFDKEQQRLVELKDGNLEDFHKKQTKLNQSLDNLDQLDDKIYTYFLNDSKKMYYKLLFTGSNYFLYKLFRKIGLLKLFYPLIKIRMRLNKETSGQWNIHRCESHRDILSMIFDNEIDNYKT